MEKIRLNNFLDINLQQKKSIRKIKNIELVNWLFQVVFS